MVAGPPTASERHPGACPRPDAGQEAAVGDRRAPLPGHRPPLPLNKPHEDVIGTEEASPFCVSGERAQVSPHPGDRTTYLTGVGEGDRLAGFAVTGCRGSAAAHPSWSVVLGG